MLIITLISNGKANELTIYTILCRNDTMFYRQKQEKLKACRNSKENFTGSCFIADESYVKIVWLHAVVLIKDDIFHFRNNALWLYVIIMSRTIFRVNLHSIVCLNVKQLLAQSGRHIWSLSHSNEIRTHNHLVHKQALDSLAKMVEQYTFIKTLPSESIWKLLLFFQLLKSNRYTSFKVFVCTR